jgi:hypothetical protein
MKRVIVLGLVALLLSALLSGCAMRGWVAGRVLLEGRSNHAGTIVEVGGCRTETLADGAFVVPVWGMGVYDVVASHPGYLPARRAALMMGPSAWVDLPTVELPAGDVDADGCIDSDDWLLVWSFVGGPPPREWPLADLDGNGVVDDADLALVVGHISSGGLYICGDVPW